MSIIQTESNPLHSRYDFAKCCSMHFQSFLSWMFRSVHTLFLPLLSLSRSSNHSNGCHIHITHFSILLNLIHSMNIYMRFHFMQKYSLISPPISNETILTRRRMQKRVRDWLTVLEFVAGGENDYYYLLMPCRCPCRRYTFAWMQFLIEIPWVHSSVTNRFVRCGVLCFRCLHLRLYAR